MHNRLYIRSTETVGRWVTTQKHYICSGVGVTNYIYSCFCNWAALSAHSGEKAGCLTLSFFSIKTRVVGSGASRWKQWKKCDAVSVKTSHLALLCAQYKRKRKAVRCLQTALLITVVWAHLFFLFFFYMSTTSGQQSAVSKWLNINITACPGASSNLTHNQR